MLQKLSVLVELANLGNSPEAIKRFAKNHREYTAPTDTLKVRDQLRELWRGGTRADRIATRFLCEGPFLVSTMNARVDWRRGTLVYKPQNQFQADLYELLKCSDRAKFCARPDCPAPYFIASNRISARYCSTDCRASALLEAKRKWWKENRGKRA